MIWKLLFRNFRQSILTLPSRDTAESYGLWICICKFTPKSVAPTVLWSFVDMYTVAQNLSKNMHIPSWDQTRRCSAFLFQLLCYIQVCFCGLLRPQFFFCIFVFCWRFHYLKWPWIIVLSSIPKHKRAMICLTEKLHVLEKLCSGMNYNGIGHEFSGNEPTIY